jgi:uncharacterized protein YceK
MNPADVGLHRVKVVRIPVVVLCLLLAGCASVVRNPVPEADHRSVTVLDNPDVRQWGDGSGSTPLSAIKDQAEWEKKFGGVMHTEHNYLVISGGGPRGAYGAGVLTAWTKLGTRPEFTIVTGVSTGALTAPFAFLGSKYDEQLKTVYTTLDTRQIINTPPPSRGLFHRFTSKWNPQTAPNTMKCTWMVAFRPRCSSTR